jgi:sugar lactone lactonase YvrE
MSDPNFIEGININSPYGIALNNNNLYVSQYSSNSVVVYNIKTGQINTVINTGLVNPAGIVCDNINNLYITNQTNSTVTKYNPDTGVNYNFITGIKGSSGITIDSNNNLYISAIFGNTIGKYNSSNGSVINANYIVGLDGPAELVFDENNNLYVANYFGTTVGKYNCDNNDVGTIINANFITGLSAPVGLTFDNNNNNLYVSNSGNGTIGQYNINTGQAINNSIITGLNYPLAILYYNNYLYVANFGGNSLDKYYINPPPRSAILKNGTNQLYNQTFCDLFQSTTNNGFSTCDNCDFSFKDGDNVLSTSSTGGEQQCLKSCADNEFCTSYTFLGNSSSNSSSDNCTLYGLNNQYPTQINTAVVGSYSGYAITSPKASYNYNNLTNKQKKNVQLKCTSQYLNNTFTPKNPKIDISSCITFSNQSNNTTQINTDPECIFNIYEQNGGPVENTNSANYINPSGINTGAVEDPNITNYEDAYNQYNTLKKQNSNINNILASEDNNQYYSEVNTNYNTLSKDFLANIKGQGGKLSNLSSQINQTIGGNIESFVNINKNNNNNNKLLIIMLIIFFALFLIFIFKKK